MKRNKLFANLMDAAYLADVGEADGAFLDSLCEPIPFKPKAVDWRTEGVLAEIPANQAAALKRSIEWHEDAIEEERTFYMEEVYGHEHEQFCPSRSAAEYIRSLQADIFRLEEELAAL